MDADSTVINALLKTLDVAVFIRKSSGDYEVWKSPPDWFEEFYSFIFPDAQNLNSEYFFPYLRSFLEDLDDFWSDTRKHIRNRKSGWWMSVDNIGNSHYFQAFAAKIDNENCLLIMHAPSNDDIFRTLEKYKKAVIELEEISQANEEVKKELEKYTNLSLADKLTGLPNQTGFYAQAKQKLSDARDKKIPTLVLAVGLNDLNQINTAHGFSEGSIAVLAISEILKTTFAKTDIISRFGGGEFAVFAVETLHRSVEKISPRIEKNVRHHSQKNVKPYQLSLNIGVVRIEPTTEISIEDMVQMAFSKMYEAKSTIPPNSRPSR